MFTATIRFHESAEQPFGAIQRVVGLVKIRHLVPLLTVTDLDSNPRSSKVGAITDAIRDSIDRTPDTFPAKTKGLLVGSSSYRRRERQRFELEFRDPHIEGILDGGHNALALGLELLALADVDEASIRKIRLWADFSEVWAANLDILTDMVRHSEDADLDVLVPVELVLPVDPDDPTAIEEFTSSLLDICAARNNNAQLGAETKANQRGYFDSLKSIVPAEISDKVEWKQNDGGKIKAADIVALSWIPLSLLDLPADDAGRPVEAPVPQNIYRSKGDCVARFERLMSSPDVTTASADDYHRDLVSDPVESAFKIAGDLPDLYDMIYERLPDAYNSNDGKFGRIVAVKKMNPEDSRRKRYTKFRGREVATAIPEGFVIPLVVGLQSLMEVDRKGKVFWKCDPTKFIDEHFVTVVGDFKSAISLLEYDPQKVGKSPDAYRMAKLAYEMVILRSK